MRPTAEPPTAFSAAGLRWWILLALLWFASIDLIPWFEPDEGRYAEIPREMAASGDWVTPRLDGLKYFEKPPLQYWATAAMERVFGVTEWTARAWSLTLAFLCLPLTYAWVARGYGRAAALAAVTVLGTSPYFVLVAHLNLLDSGLAFFLTATVFAFTSAQTAPQGGRRERAWMLTAWAAAALAVLSKGIVVAVLAGLSLLVYSLIQRDWTSWRRLHLSLGLPLFLLIAAPWFIAVQMRNPEFSQFFFLHEHFARFLTTVHQRVEPWWYFLPIAALAFLPWLGELKGVWDVGAREAGAQVRRGQFAPLRFLLIYSLVVLVFFSISQSKLPPYILPMLPPLAALIGIHLGGAVAPWRRAALICAALASFVAIGVVLFVRHRYHVVPGELIAFAAAGALVSLLAFVGVSLSRTLSNRALFATAGGLLSWQLFLLAHAAGPLDRSASDMLIRIRPHIHPDTRIYAVYQYRQTVPPYLKRQMTIVEYRGELDFGMSQEPERNTETLEEFLHDWYRQDDAIAFVEPDRLEELRARGMPGRILDQDPMSVAVSRH